MNGDLLVKFLPSNNEVLSHLTAIGGAYFVTRYIVWCSRVLSNFFNSSISHLSTKALHHITGLFVYQQLPRQAFISMWQPRRLVKYDKYTCKKWAVGLGYNKNTRLEHNNLDNTPQLSASAVSVTFLDLVTLWPHVTFWPLSMTFKTWSVLGPTIVSICVNFRSHSVAFTIFLWPLLPDPVTL